MNHTEAITIIQQAIADGRTDSAEHRRFQTEKLKSKVFRTYTECQQEMNKIDILFALWLNEQKQLF